jgi:hypothetical protein
MEVQKPRPRPSVSSKWIVAKTTRRPKTDLEEINGDLLEADFWPAARAGS